ncbi:MAG: hypothetical protein NTV87_06310, partial [Ignavibacteriae bacterium]|nr:hypothetical protein [Ignavibacteriota bacterium]
MKAVEPKTVVRNTVKSQKAKGIKDEGKKAEVKKAKGIKDEENKQDSFPIVGIGASAGGLEALEQFFGNMPKDSGIAFVVIQHLDPKYVG